MVRLFCFTRPSPRQSPDFVRKLHDLRAFACNGIGFGAIGLLVPRLSTLNPKRNKDLARFECGGVEISITLITVLARSSTPCVE